MIVVYCFRRKKWVDFDNDAVDLVNWFSTRREETGRLIRLGQLANAQPAKKRTYKHWTKNEEGFVAKNYILMSNKELADALDRSIDSVMVKLTELDLLRPSNFRRLRKKEVPSE